MITDKSTDAYELLAQKLVELNTFEFHFGGQFLADPNEFNGWGPLGPHDNSNTQGLGNVGDTVSNLAGGFCFPYDVQPIRLFAWHRDNNAALGRWGWRIEAQTKMPDSTTVTNVEILREVVGAGATAVAPRDYTNTRPQQTDVDLSSAPIVSAGSLIVLGIESPVTDTTNRFVQVYGGYIQLRRV